MTDFKHQELFMVKDLFLHGKRHAFYESKFDRRLAIVSFHNSIELFIRDALNTKSVGSDTLDKKKFEEKIKCFEDRCLNKEEILFKGKILELNRLRNKIYHSYEVPDKEKVEEFKFITNEFLIEMTNKVFRVNFEELSFFDIDEIKNPYVKKYYRDATINLEKGEYQKSGSAYYEAFKEQWNSIYGPSTPSLPLLQKDKHNETFETIIDAINDLTLIIKGNLKLLQMNTVRKEHLHLKWWIEDIFPNYGFVNFQGKIKSADVDKFKRLLEEFIIETNDYISEYYLQIRLAEYKQDIQAEEEMNKWLK